MIKGPSQNLVLTTKQYVWTDIPDFSYTLDQKSIVVVTARIPMTRKVSGQIGAFLLNRYDEVLFDSDTSVIKIFNKTGNLFFV